MATPANARLATFYLFAAILPYLQILRFMFVDTVGDTVGDHLRIDTFLIDLYNGSSVVEVFTDLTVWLGIKRVIEKNQL